jgi:hypothetical protein
MGREVLRTGGWIGLVIIVLAVIAGLYLSGPTWLADLIVIVGLLLVARDVVRFVQRRRTNPTG